MKYRPRGNEWIDIPNIQYLLPGNGFVWNNTTTAQPMSVCICSLARWDIDVFDNALDTTGVYIYIYSNIRIYSDYELSGVGTIYRRMYTVNYS